MRTSHSAHLVRRLVFSIAFLGIGLAVACGDEQDELVVGAPTKPPALATTQAQVRATEVAVQSSTPEPDTTGSTESGTVLEAPLTDGYDSNAIMYEIIPDAIYSTGTGALMDALAKIDGQRDVLQVPVLVESMEYFGGNARRAIVAVLQTLTGEEITSRTKWREWMGRNLSEYDFPDDYPAWKTAALALTDDRYSDFLGEWSETSRIDLREVLFGGRRPDEIPDLRDPKSIPAEEVDYLFGDDRVLGVTINGEDRAYPLRIINGHELVNDTLGGEPITVLW